MKVWGIDTREGRVRSWPTNGQRQIVREEGRERERERERERGGGVWGAIWLVKKQHLDC